MGGNIIFGLDIGTTYIKAVVAERDKEGKPKIIFALKEPTLGMRKGVIVDLADTAQSVSNVLGEVKKVSKNALRHIYASIGTPQITIHPSKGITAVSGVDAEIYEEDVDRVLKASQAINTGVNRKIIHNVIVEYIVDGVGDIQDPLGLSGGRLEVNSLLIDVFEPHLKSISHVIELCGGKVVGIVASPMASSKSVLSKIQKDLGVLLIDLGGGTTSMTVYEEGKLLALKILPIGAINVTKDIAVGLKVPVNIAERLKIEDGYAYSKEIGIKESIDFAKFNNKKSLNVSRRYLAEIIEYRLAEILELINNELKALGKARELAGGVVIVGGGAKLPGITELSQQELKLSTQLGSAIREWWSEEGENGVLENPEFSTALGLILYGAEEREWLPKEAARRLPKWKKIWRYFIP